MKTIYTECPVCHKFSLNKQTKRCENQTCHTKATGRVNNIIKEHKCSLIYLAVFFVLIFFSPFRGVIFTLEFFENFQIIDSIRDKMNKDKERDEPYPPNIYSPLLESSIYIKGKATSPNTILIYINNIQKYTTIAKEGGYFEYKVDGQLKIGDAVSAKQKNKDSKESDFSSIVVVSDKDLNWAKYKMEEEKEKTHLIESSCAVLISWSVLLLGGLSYVILYKRTSIHLLWLTPFIIFLLVLSVYYGMSTKHAIITALTERMPVLYTTDVDDYWWKQIKSFERGLFIVSLLLLWNLGVPSSSRKGDKL